MATMRDIELFLSSRTVALVGLSREDSSFSRLAWKEFRDRGYEVSGVNPHIRGESGVFFDLASIPTLPDAAIFFTPKAVTRGAVEEAFRLGIKRIWIQQGAESPEAIAYCAEKVPGAVLRQCVLMHLSPVKSIHAFHRGLKRFFGGLPR